MEKVRSNANSVVMLASILPLASVQQRNRGVHSERTSTRKDESNANTANWQYVPEFVEYGR